MSDINRSNNLSFTDAQTLTGFTDVEYFEPPQLTPAFLPPVTEEIPETTSQRLQKTRDRADGLLKEINRLKNEVDSRCSKFKVTSSDGKGSRLFQAMVRVFGERTTTVTYDHYKRAIELRQKLVEEDADSLRKS